MLFCYSVESLNEGKGIPLTLHLHPIESIIKMCNVDNNFTVIPFQPLSSETVHKCVSHFEALHDASTKPQ